MMQTDLGPLFPLGKVSLSPGAKKSLPGRELVEAIMCYMGGPCSSCPREGDQFHFPFALDGCRVVGTYRASNGQKILIVTEADRSRTTVMLPGEF